MLILPARHTDINLLFKHATYHHYFTVMLRLFSMDDLNMSNYQLPLRLKKLRIKSRNLFILSKFVFHIFFPIVKISKF